MSIISNILNNKSDERLRQLIEAIRTRDFSLQYSLDHLKGEERRLAQQINEVVNEFRETTMRQEAKYQYFGTMLDTINAFLIVADEQGIVHWMNRAAVDGLCGFAINRLQDLKVVDDTLPETMKALKPGQQRLVQLIANNNNRNEEKADFMLSVVNFFNKGFAYRLYTLQNVQPVIQKNETDAQQQLVISHCVPTDIVRFYLAHRLSILHTHRTTTRQQTTIQRFPLSKDLLKDE